MKSVGAFLLLFVTTTLFADITTEKCDAVLSELTFQNYDTFKKLDAKDKRIVVDDLLDGCLSRGEYKDKAWQRENNYRPHEVLARLEKYLTAELHKEITNELRNGLTDPKTNTPAFPAFVLGTWKDKDSLEIVRNNVAKERLPERQKDWVGAYGDYLDQSDADTALEEFNEHPALPDDARARALRMVRTNPKLLSKIETEVQEIALKTTASNDLRTEAIIALESIGSEKVMRTLFRIATETDKSNTVQLFAAMKLGSRRFVPHAKELAKLIVDLVQSDTKLEYTELLVAFENHRSDLTAKELEAFDQAFRTYFQFRKPEAKPCSTLCNLVGKAEQWDKDDFINNPEFWEKGNPVFSWQFAIRSLAVFFATKAAPFCPEAKKLVDKHRDKLAKLFAETQLHHRDERKGPKDASVIYSEIFYSAILREWVREAVGDTKKQFQDHLTEVESALRRDMERFDKYMDGVDGNSLFNTYALAAAALAIPDVPKKVKDIFVELTTKGKSPLHIPYYPALNRGLEGRATPRGGAARAVLVYLFRYRSEKNATEKGKLRKQTLAALDNYLFYLPDLMLHVGRNATHVGEAGIAPYYFYPSIPYATAAIREFLEQENDPTERKALLTRQNRLEAALVTNLRKDGVMKPQGMIQFRSSTGYVNPLAGLAYIPLIETCGEKGVPPSLGIAEVLAENLKTVRPTAVRPPAKKIKLKSF